MKQQSQALILLTSLWCATTAVATETPAVGLIQLASKLDRPQDGFCIDVIGFSPYQRVDLPMIAHNCKPGLYDDQALSILANGHLYLPAYKKCVTAIAPYVRALPGAALMARNCGERSNFLETENLQRFEFNKQGKIKLVNSDLCIAVGSQSDQTSAASHRWRALFLEKCDQIATKYSAWRFIAKTKGKTS